jgi:hypothetical protein
MAREEEAYLQLSAVLDIIKAEELWINSQNSLFWGFQTNEEDSNTLLLTQGKIYKKHDNSNNSHDFYHVCDSIKLRVSNVDEFLVKLCEQKEQAGYRCFAMEI